MNILLALDGSENSEAIFEAALREVRDKRHDKVIVICVSETPDAAQIAATLPPGQTSILPQDPTEFDRQKRLVPLLTKYANRLQSIGVQHHVILGVAEHVGTLICQAVLEKQISLLVMGRRKAGKWEKTFAGSTSKYCIENAECNLLVVKDELPSEVHPDVTQVIKAEEEERARRIREDAQVPAEIHPDVNKVIKLEEEERARRIKEFGNPQEELKEDQANREITKQVTHDAEEKERQRRIKEEELLDMKEKIAREQSIRAAIQSEDKEQARRIEEEKQLDAAQEAERERSISYAIRAEDLEQARRIEQEPAKFLPRDLKVELLSLNKKTSPDVV